ncbi:MAG: MFS transporter [Candidatus Promineofilum sp.]|nr:MFS transporter [Promineifilum sp.]
MLEDLPQLESTHAPLDDVDYSRKWYVMAAIAMGIFLATIDGSIVNVALPTLTTALDTDFATVQWVVLSYLLTVTTLQAVVGRLADMYGRKMLYNSGFVVFTVGSLLCGLSPTAGWLIAARVLQGVGGALTLALGMAIVTDAFPSAERGRALGISGSIVSIGIVTGPTLGGLIIEHLSWHWIFFVNVPIGIIGTWMAWRYIPRTRPPGGQIFDFAGAATLCIFLLGLLLGLTTGQRDGFTSPQALALFVVAIFFLLTFILLERRHPQPIIPPSLFTNRIFRINIITGLLVFVAMGVYVLIPFYLEMALLYSVQQVGLLLSVVPLALGISSPISGVLSDRVGSRPISVLGLAVTVVAFLLLGTLTAETTAVGFMLRYLPLGIGVGLFQSPNNSAIMGSVTRDRLGVASSLLAVTRSLGQTVGFAVLGAVWAGMVVRAAGEGLTGGAESAPPAAISAGIQGTALVSAALVAVALAVALVAWRRERRLG